MTSPSTSPFTFTGTVSLPEFERIQQRMLPVWARWYVAYPVLAAVWLGVTLPGTSRVDVGSDLVFTLLFLLVMVVVTQRSRAKAWRQLVRRTGRVHGALTPEGIEWNTLNSASRFEWAKITKVVHARDLTLAFYAPRRAFWFPRCFFESDQAWAAFNAEIDARVPG